VGRNTKERVEPDAQGHYTVVLGATQTEGLPANLFSSGEARWLGVETPGLAPQPRVLLVSVPYALRAVEAEKLAGKSASDFVLSETLSDQVRQVIQSSPSGAAAVIPSARTLPGNSASAPSTLPPTTFNGNTTNQVVLVQQTGTGSALIAISPHKPALVGKSADASGVYAQSSSPVAPAVVGKALSTSSTTFPTGVYGETEGGGSGVGGLGNSATGSGVYGQTNGAGAGVVGIASTASGFGMFAQTPGFAAVFGQNTATSGAAAGLFGSTASPLGAGVSGGGTSYIGVAGSTSATTGSPSYGVWGDSASDQGVAVAGFEDATTGPTIGVYGTDASSSGIGVSGYASSPTGGTVGVLGQVLSPGGTGGAFVSLSGQGLLLQGISGTSNSSVFTLDASGNLQISGNLTVNGTKSSTARLQNGHEVLLYAVESPENWFEDFGSSKTTNGVAWVPLDANFAEASNATIEYHVFLTPNGDSNGLYVSRKAGDGFEVREHGGGTSNVAFDYRIVARRRGFETVRMAEVHPPKTEVTAQVLRQQREKMHITMPKPPPQPIVPQRAMAK